MSHQSRYTTYDEKENVTPKRKPIMKVETSYFTELFWFIDWRTYVNIIHLAQIRYKVTLFYAGTEMFGF
jgi:hypothetical protein